MPSESIVITIIGCIIATYGLLVMALSANCFGFPRLDFSRAMVHGVWGQIVGWLRPIY